MNKKSLIQKIITRLEEELAAYHRAALTAHEEATHEQSKAEGKYDTRGLEASYLAHAQSLQAAELMDSLTVFKSMDGRKFTTSEPIGIGALVELEETRDDERTFYFIASRAGGMEIAHEKQEVLVITPQSPLGAQLQGAKQGDLLKLQLGGTKHQYRIANVA